MNLLKLIPSNLHWGGKLSTYIIMQRFQHASTIQCPRVNRDVVDSKVKPVFRYANDYADRIALNDVKGEYTYRSLFNASVTLSKEIGRLLNHNKGERVAFLCPNDASYIITQWASWMSGQTVVPLSKLHPPNLLEYYITDSDANLIVTTQELSDSISSLATNKKSNLLIIDQDIIKGARVQKDTKNIDTENLDTIKPEITGPSLAGTLDAGLEPAFYQSADAMLIYTSGTTGPPKGVVVTHQNIHTQVQGMISAWGWSQKDIILHTLPLHHVHGITNALITPLSIGAKIVMLPQWNTRDVWTRLLAVKKSPEQRVNVFMGVPTMYSKLIEEYDLLFAENKRQAEFIRSTLTQKIRLMVSGSAALPEPLLRRWHEISGHTLLERYGMSETGMVLSNPLLGERRPGFVGVPLPGVRVRIVSKDSPTKVLAESDDNGTTHVYEKKGPVSGDLEVKGSNVFRAYYGKPEITAKEFTKDGWFKTGDTAEFSQCYYKILGRTSVDIIKTGGFKVSALDVETSLLDHPDIADVAVVGLPDELWGEKIAAVITLKDSKSLELSTLREWGKGKMAPYTIPTELKIVDAIPRNQMGKINKKELVKTLFDNKLNK